MSAEKRFSDEFGKVWSNRRVSVFLLSTHYLFLNLLFLPQQVQAQSASSTPIFNSVTVSPKFRPDPEGVRGISGGTEAANEIAGRLETPNGPCVGYMEKNPSHRLVLTSPFNYLRVQVVSPGDTTIVISGPGGTWCNDDYQGKNAGVAGQWLPGTYNIWVGSLKKDKYSRYTLCITEVE